jgi:hypothetical protein
MDSEKSLEEVRVRILHTLKDSVEAFKKEADLGNITERHDTILTNKLRLVLLEGRQAIRILEAFWQETRLYSTNRCPSYVWISRFLLNGQDGCN